MDQFAKPAVTVAVYGELVASEAVTEFRVIVLPEMLRNPG